MTETQITDDYLIKNAIHCWLHHFPDHTWTIRYQELAQRDTYIQPTESNEKKPRAARRRKPKVSQSSEV